MDGTRTQASRMTAVQASCSSHVFTLGSWFLYNHFNFDKLSPLLRRLAFGVGPCIPNATSTQTFYTVLLRAKSLWEVVFYSDRAIPSASASKVLDCVTDLINTCHLTQSSKAKLAVHALLSWPTCTLAKDG